MSLETLEKRNCATARNPAQRTDNREETLQLPLPPPPALTSEPAFLEGAGKRGLCSQGGTERACAELRLTKRNLGIVVRARLESKLLGR